MELAMKSVRFDSLLVAIDFSATADRMLPIVGRLASRGGLPMRLLTTGTPDLAEYDVADLAERARQIHGCPVSTMILNSDAPAADLAEFAKSETGALLCLASHGRTALGELVLGSMTEDLLARHVGPMLAVGPHVPDAYELSDNLIVAIDEFSIGTSLIDTARAWQETFGGTVDVFEAVTRRSTSVPLEPTAELRRAGQQLPGAVTTVVESHDPVRAIADAAMSSNSPIAVASHARGGLERLVRGSVSGELLRANATPLLIVSD
jgi:nucleotide-binding universal stress UspA family protein